MTQHSPLKYHVSIQSTPHVEQSRGDGNDIEDNR